VGIDKGYTEAFPDSDGVANGLAFGAALTQYSDAASATGKGRNKLHALEKKHRAAGRVAKVNRIQQCNLGRLKIDARKERARKHLRSIAYDSAHAVVDKAAVVVSEDLSSPIASKVRWKRYNRRLGAWAKGVLAESVGSVCTQRKARHVLVCGAYTSQMDSTNGLLQGKRVGDKFYREAGGCSLGRPQRCFERAGSIRRPRHQSVHSLQGSSSNPALTFFRATERQQA